MKAHLQVKHLITALKSHRYILARYSDGVMVGINSKILTHARFSNLEGRRENETNYIGYRPCGFQEYISHKTPFL
jgi:hypothetical protein